MKTRIFHPDDEKSKPGVIPSKSMKFSHPTANRVAIVALPRMKHGSGKPGTSQKQGLPAPFRFGHFE